MSRDTDLDYDLWTMPAAITDTTFEAWTLEFSQDGSPIILTGATIVMTFFNYEGQPAVQSFSVGDGLTITDGSNGILQIDEHDITLIPNEYLIGVSMTLATGDKLNDIRGTWLIKHKR